VQLTIREHAGATGVDYVMTKAVFPKVFGALDVDPITLRIFQQRLIGIVGEMRSMMVRSAFSSSITELIDLSCAIFSKSGDLVAQFEDNPQHIFPIVWSVREVLEKYGDEIEPDDLFLHNDPYTGGTHLNDVCLIVPLFRGGKPAFFPVVRAHWEDVGGATFGSISGNSRTIHQEGVRIPVTRLKVGSRELEIVLRLLLANMRLPEEREADFKAMLGTCQVAGKRLNNVIDRYGLENCNRFVAALLDQEERRMRRKIAGLPDGRYVYENYLDPRPDLGRTVKIRVQVTIAGDEIDIDASGSSAPIEAPINGGPSTAPTGAFIMLKSLIDTGGPVNSGSFRCIRVNAPKGTYLNSQYPFPCGQLGDGRRAYESTIMAALAAVVPDRATGEVKSTSNQIFIGGHSAASGESFILYEAPAGGTGAFQGSDGNHTLRTFNEGDFSAIQSVEAIEQKYPLLVERCALRTDSCGDGAYRGGLGMVRTVRVLSDIAVLSLASEKHVVPPFGLFGGASGWPISTYIQREGRMIVDWPVPGKVGSYPLKRGDLFVVETNGGGGYGDPLERDPQRVTVDIAMGYITRRKADDVYGIVLAGDRLDANATARRRQELRASRLQLTLTERDVADDPGYFPRCWLHPSVIKRLALGTGDLIELLAPQQAAAPLRLAATADAAVAVDVLCVPASLRSFYGLCCGIAYVLRRPDPPVLQGAAAELWARAC
jgi:N-methylhydantoinase B